MSSAPDLGFYGPVVRVTDHAIRRRLMYEGVSFGHSRYLLDQYRHHVEREILKEFRSCRHLLPQARSVLSKPWREYSRDQKLPRHKRVHRPSASSHPFRSVAGEYYLLSDQFCYIVDHQQIVTMIVPTQSQIDAVEYVMGPPENVSRPVSIIDLMCDVDLESSPRPKIIDPVIRPRTVHARKAITVRSMSRRPASWAYMVVDDITRRSKVDAAAENDASIPTNEALVRNAVAWVRHAYGDRLPEPIYVDALSPDLMEAVQRRLSFLRILSLPEPPAIDWTPDIVGNVPSSVRRWWKRVLKLTSSGNQLVTFLLPETARMIHEITSGDSFAEWRKDPHFFDPGAVHVVHRK